ncbi:DUF1501 domain-containing protein [Mesorhizobium sp. M0220]|uniref:DUF1501 domain-containing protein n=1 Tax=unclassified Mesorhizobium TaxID=325217 RepID=UPI00333D60CE
MRAGLGEVWRQTAVLVATEFGRTAAVNGTGGTDHGTASAANGARRRSAWWPRTGGLARI